ncbi:MAG TPA: ATP-binding cassette domain-containing protein [Candidatus Paenibacillus intestinavium]|nr:ATP-binding cassette domain-containing protein [Candidatus Paenibacillus intestinavium]
MPILEVEHLTKDYGHNRGVFDVSFHVEKGEVYGFLGPNGAGKTTTIRHIMGFSRPQSGFTLVNGLSSWENASDIQTNLGYLPGEIALPESLTGIQFIKMMAELRGLKDTTHTDYLINKFELDPAGGLKRMSLGMKRKLAIVTAFMHDPALLVLDEPTSGLDPIMQQVFIDFIKEEKEKGKTILLSSHIFKEIDATCDKISIIKEGRLTSTFIANEIRHNEHKTYEFEFSTAEEFQRFSSNVTALKPFEIISLKNSNNQASIRVHDSDINDFISIISDYDLRFFSEIKFTLEEYFMKFYERNSNLDGGAPKNAVN